MLVPRGEGLARTARPELDGADLAALPLLGIADRAGLPSAQAEAGSPRKES